jgi:hypothetical protein
MGSELALRFVMMEIRVMQMAVYLIAPDSCQAGLAMGVLRRLRTYVLKHVET